MAQPSAPEAVKYFVAVLWADETTLAAARTALERHFAAVDFEGADHPFDATDYYEPEMGRGLHRRLLAFDGLRSPEELPAAKLICIRLEDDLAAPAGRRVNLDVGYLDHNKVVLASVKAAGQKIYLRDGIYADLIARYEKGHYAPFPWTFPDFRTGRYDAELNRMREIYLAQRRS
jgi:hypothetical protein